MSTCKKPTNCNRCKEWCKYDRKIPLLNNKTRVPPRKSEIFQDDYYGDICTDCYEYLESINWNNSHLDTCAECKTPTISPVECGRCADGHGDPEPLCEDCIFQDDYYHNGVCSECFGYLKDNQ